MGSALGLFYNSATSSTAAAVLVQQLEPGAVCESTDRNASFVAYDRKRVFLFLFLFFNDTNDWDLPYDPESVLCRHSSICASTALLLQPL